MKERIHIINKYSPEKKRDLVVYWVQTSLRIDYNYGLNLAINLANELKKPLVVYFGVKNNQAGNLRQYQFLKEGLLELKGSLNKLGINFFVEKIEDFNDIIKFSQKACCFVCDFGYLKEQQVWRKEIFKRLTIPTFTVESDVLVPVKILSDRRVNFAFQIRKKIFKAIPYFAQPFRLNTLLNKTEIFNQTNDEIEKIFNQLNIDRSVKPTQFIGGELMAKKQLKIFLEEKLSFYKKYRSDPTKDYQSNLSPYLRFGFIPPVRIIREVLKHYSSEDENVIAFFNELIVWRELARNFVFYDPNYGNWQSLPLWAKKTLDDHRQDKKNYLYDLKTLENGKTHDLYWNSAQKEMIITGKMHNYMRMYWGKKVIEWVDDWRKAYKILLYLNDKYELDGRDPNGYAGVSWCFGNFDRPWVERAILGRVRYMSDSGLKRKFDIDIYVNKIEKWARLEQEYKKVDIA